MHTDSTSDIAILWADDTAVIVNKPSGLLVHNSHYAGPKEVSLRQIVSTQLDLLVYPVHRLDRPTSGIVLFTKGREWYRAWHDRLVDPSTNKNYIALVRGHVREDVFIDHPLKQGDALREARSHVQTLLHANNERCSLVCVSLETGRRHQVRRHLAHISHPLIGDTTYGKGDINRHYRAKYGLYRLALHARQLEINHPLTQQRIQLFAPLPEELMSVFAMLFPAGELITVMGENDT